MEKPDTYTAEGNIIRPIGWETVEERVDAKSLSDVDHCQTGRRFISDDDMPAKALTWRTRSQKAKALEGWRIEVGKTFAESARVLRVAWALEAMFGNAKRYARVTDSYLSRKLGMPLKNIQTTMTKLERSGLIVRVSVVVDSKTHRRIWPVRADARPATGNFPGLADRGCRS